MSRKFLAIITILLAGIAYWHADDMFETGSLIVGIMLTIGLAYVVIVLGIISTTVLTSILVCLLNFGRSLCRRTSTKRIDFGKSAREHEEEIDTSKNSQGLPGKGHRRSDYKSVYPDGSPTCHDLHRSSD